MGTSNLCFTKILGIDIDNYVLYMSLLFLRHFFKYKYVCKNTGRSESREIKDMRTILLRCSLNFRNIALQSLYSSVRQIKSVDSQVLRHARRSRELGLGPQSTGTEPRAHWLASFIDCSQFAAKMVEKEGSDPNPYPDSPLGAATIAWRADITDHRANHSLLKLQNTATRW